MRAVRLLPRRLLFGLPLVVAIGCTTYTSEYVATRQDGTRGLPVRIEYEGVESIARFTLSQVIERPMIDLSRDFTRETRAQDAAKAVADHYRSLGFPEVTVGSVVEPVLDEKGQRTATRVRFTIAEGPEVVVDELVLEGNHSIPTVELMRHWRRRPSGTLVLGPPLYVERDLQTFVKEMQARYQGEGYFLAKVEDPVTERLEDGHARVIVRIQEGPLHSIRKLDLDPRLAKPLGDDVPPTLAGKTYTDRAVGEYALRVRLLLRELGYPDPRMRVLRLGEGGKPIVDIVVQGDPGSTAHVGEIAVRGIDRVPEIFVRSKLDLEVGEVFRGSAEDRAVQALYRTGRFQKVRVLHEPMEEDRIRLVLEVEEAVTPAVTLQPGYGTYEKARGALRLEERDVFGTGHDAHFVGKIHTKGYDADASITNPDLLGEWTGLTVGGGLRGREEPSFTDRSRSATAFVSQDLGFLTSRVGYTFEDHHGSTFETVDPSAQLVEYDQGHVFGVMGVDSRDSPLFPRTGQTSTWRVEYAHAALGGDVRYLKTTWESTSFWPLSRDATLMARLGMGLLWPGQGSAGVPLQARFFAGGENTVRSFRESQLGPKDVTGEPVGGEFRNVLNLEARYRLLPPIELVAFFDAGNVGRQVEAWGFSNLSYAVGVGLSYLPPVGIPVRVDAAMNPDREPGEEEWVLHLRVGYPF